MPDADFNGAAGFDYTVSDGTLQATAHVTLQLAPVNDAPRPVEDLLSTDEDTTLTVATDALVANDIDVEGSPLTILSVSSPSHGSVQLTSGTVRFVPDPDYFGPAGFQYVVSDGVLTAVAHVGITVVPVNDPPVAGNDGFTDSEDTALSVEAAELLANDSDIEGDQLSVVAVQNGLNGDVSLSGTTVVFVPAANFNGAAGFDYVVSDGALTAVGHVFVSVLPVNDPPVAVDDALTTNEDSSVQFTQATLLANDSDVDGPSISVTSTTNAQHGTVTMSGVRITFAPDPDFFGEAGFDYVVSDGSLSTTAHVVVTVLPVNDPPIAVDDTLSTPEDTALVVPGSTLVSNDTDIDSPVLFVASVSNPLHGAVSLLDGVVTFLPEANFNGAASFDYVVSDGALTDAGHVSVTVEPVNDAPVAVDDAFTLNEDETLTLAGTQLLANDFDIDSPTLTVLSVQDAVNGAVALAGQSITFTPDANFNGTATFTYTITDGALTGTATVTLTVLPVDDAPVAVDDAVTTDEDQPLPVATDTLVANDTDIDGPALSVTAVASPENGTVTLVDGVVTFTPDPDFNGTGAFTYTVSDGSLTAQGTVTVTVVPVNDPPVAVDDSRFVDEDTALTFAASELTLNDTDVDSLVLTVVAAGNPAHGTVALSDGLISFLPEANFNGTAGFDYTVSDGALTATAHVAVTVLPVDDAPVGVDDTLSTDEDVPLSIDAAILLANDTDIDGPALSVTAVSSPLHCTVALSNSTVTITPDADFNGAAEFDYTLSDGTLTSTAHVTVTVVPVDDAPVPAADSATTAEDTPLSLLPATLLANDTDIDGPALSLTAVAGATNGTVSLQSGNVVFTPAADFNGTAGFDYTVSDGTLTALGHVTVTVTPVNDAPVGVADSATTAEDAALVVQGSVLVANDVDIDGPALSVTAVSGATNGVVSLVGNTITFTPDANFNGSAGFDYTVSDGALTGTAHVTVTVTPVDDAPIAVADSATIAEDTSFIALGSVLTSNDTDIDGPSLTVTAVSNAVNGIVSLGSGSITFTPTLNFNGTAGFDYTVSDGTLTAVGHVTVTVTPVNDAPTVVADTITTPEDTAAVINDATLLSNDSDVDSPSITLTGVSSPTNGTVVLSAGVITFTPTANFNGTAGFDYTVSDGTLSTTGHVTVTVTAVDDPPVAVNDSRTTNEDVALVISSASLTANDTDIDGPSLTVTAVSNATNGTVSLSSGTITFTPALNFNGTAGFDYSLSDGTFTVTGHVTVTVTAVNDPPVGVADSVTTPEDTAVAVAATTLLANDTDVDSGSLTLTAVSAPTNGTVSLSSGTVTFTPSANFNGTAGFNYTVSDGAATGTGHVTVTVFAVNDAPVAVNDTASISTNGTLILSASTLMANDSDVDSIITVVSVSNSVNGTVSLSGTTITFTPTIGFTGTASFQYTISDGSLTATATVTVTVSGCVLGTDTDGDRLDDCYETGTGVYVSFTDTGTSKTNADTDGDGIKDGDEVLGTTGGLDLPSLGANPLRKDLFLEYDWFTDAIGCASHSHQPTAAAIARVTAAFAAAPVSNPDGTTGITMHNDYGQGAPFTGGNFVSDADGVLTSGVNSTEFNNIKTANFATNRRGYFHYVVLPHNYNTNSTSSGQAELPGNDLVVSLQCFTSTVNVGNTIMHELGHNLNLRHGGNSDCNYKPNYNSVMNYKFQFPGIDTNCDSSGDGTLSYSVGSRISLTESNLNEGLGVCGTTSINWNGTNGIESSISFDVNSSDTSEASACGGTLTTLTDYNDWANLSLSGGLNDADGASANPQLLASVPSEVVDCDNPAPPDLPDTP
jgi:predicted glutamine amidotransferase